MIPEFDANGHLPSGVHPAALREILDRFGRGSEVREAQAQSLQWLVPLCKPAGIARCVLNGSFVTDVAEPNDVDCVLLQGPDYRRSSPAAKRLRRGLPFLEIHVATQRDFQFLVNTMFASDRDMVPKGMVEVILDDQQ